MKRFSESSRCDKCGRVNAKATFNGMSGLLLRECNRCGYLWDEFPLDDSSKVEE